MSSTFERLTAPVGLVSIRPPEIQSATSSCTRANAGGFVRRCAARLQSTETASSRRKSIMIGLSPAASSSPRSRTARSWRVSFGSSSPTSTFASRTTSRIIVKRFAVFYSVSAERDRPLQLPQLAPWHRPKPRQGLSRSGDDKLPLFRRKSSKLRSQRTELLWNRDSVGHRLVRLACGFGAGDILSAYFRADSGRGCEHFLGATPSSPCTGKTRASSITARANAPVLPARQSAAFVVNWELRLTREIVQQPLHNFSQGLS